MSTAKVFVGALEAAATLAALSVVHRLLAFAPLAGNLPLLSIDGGKALLVGLLSDAWISYLGALLLLLWGAALAVGGQAGVARAGRIGFLLALGIGAAAHQSYVEFFHFQIQPFHLRYIVDRQFLWANGSSFFTWRAGLILLTLACVLLALFRFDPFGAWRRRTLAGTFVALTALALYAHSRNIHTRVQWFIPENLQVNPLERLYMHLETQKLPAPLAPADVTSLAALLGEDHGPLGMGVGAHGFFSLLTRPAGGEPPRPVAVAVRGAFAEAVAAKRKPVVLILLLESLRPAETGYFAPAAGKSLTPSLDALAAHGLTFTRAYSTGSVTRGAQEAAFCGYLGSRDTSLMRGEGVARLTCLPDLVAQGPTATGARGDTFWYHGGDARYDGQVAYWQLHHVHDFLSLSDFPPDAPRTGWGVSDRAFVDAVATRLAEKRAQTPADYLLGLGLTVTNHIPWDLPEDAGPETLASRAAAHESYATTAYADRALGELTAKLKASGVWRDLLLVLASDHGTSVPPLVDLYGDSGDKSGRLQSHINLIVTGGLADRALASQGVASMQLGDLVSQADVASFVGYVVDLPGARFMGQNLLRQSRALPVLSDLEEDLVDHASGRTFSRTDVVRADASSLPPAERKALLYYRAFLQYIYTAAE